jgi:hypothetical protein
MNNLKMTKLCNSVTALVFFCSLFGSFRGIGNEYNGHDSPEMSLYSLIK